MSGSVSRSRSAADNRALAFLALGAVSGALLAVSGVLASPSPAVPPGAVALVNGRAISADAYEGAARMVARDRRNPMTEADRARVLRRLIEEELLIQQGQASGLLASNASVRRAVADSMIQSVAAERESEQPEDEDLLAYFRAHPGYFAPPESMHIRELVFRQRGVPGEELERASEASRALADGLDFAAVRARYCDEPSLPIPDAPLEWAELGQYLAPRDVQELVDLAPGGTSSLLPSPMGGVRILQLVSRTDGAPPLFAAVRRDVELAYRRDAADRALSDYLDWLWDSAVIEFGEAAPATDER